MVAARTRLQLRTTVGSILGVRRGTATGGDTDSVIDTTISGGVDSENGKWVVIASTTDAAAPAGEIQQVHDTVVSGSGIDMTLKTALSASITAGDTFELWPQEFDPAIINSFLDDAMVDATGRAYDPEEDISLHWAQGISRFDIPAEMDMLQRVYYRSFVDDKEIHRCESDFDESLISSMSTALDDKDLREGGNSLKVTTAGGANGHHITDSIDSVDLSDMTHVEFWAKAATAVAAGDLFLHLHSSTVVADGSSDLESLSIPALSADTWTLVRIALANPETDTAIISVGLEYNANFATNVIWLDGIKAVNNDSMGWTEIPRHLWRVDREGRDLIVKGAGVGIANYSLMRLVGGGNPAVFSSDSSTTEIGERFIIAYTVSRALQMAGIDHSKYRRLMPFWAREADHTRRFSLPILQNVRHVA